MVRIVSRWHSLGMPNTKPNWLSCPLAGILLFTAMYIDLLRNVFFLLFGFLSAKCCRSVSIHTSIDVASIMFAGKKRKSAVMICFLLLLFFRFCFVFLSLEHIRIVLCLQKVPGRSWWSSRSRWSVGLLVLFAHLFICDSLFFFLLFFFFLSVHLWSFWVAVHLVATLFLPQILSIKLNHSITLLYKQQFFSQLWYEKNTNCDVLLLKGKTIWH